MEELSPRARQLLALARELQPPRQSKATVRRAVAASVATATTAAVNTAAAAAAASGASTACFGKGLATTIALWMSVGVATGAIAITATTRLMPAETPAASPASAFAAPTTPSARRARTPHVPFTAGPPPSAAPAAPSRRAPERRPAPARAGLTEELELLDEARAALRDGRPDRALALAEAHRSRFQGGTLAEEAAAARLLALCALGRTREGRRGVGEFEQAFPLSPQLPQIRSACTKDP